MACSKLKVWRRSGQIGTWCLAAAIPHIPLPNWTQISKDPLLFFSLFSPREDPTLSHLAHPIPVITVHKQFIPQPGVDLECWGKTPLSIFLDMGRKAYGSGVVSWLKMQLTSQKAKQRETESQPNQPEAGRILDKPKWLICTDYKNQRVGLDSDSQGLDPGSTTFLLGHLCQLSLSELQFPNVEHGDNNSPSS